MQQAMTVYLGYSDLIILYEEARRYYLLRLYGTGLLG